MQRCPMKVQSLGTSRISAILIGSRIDTQPTPMPSARATSHSVWMAMGITTWLSFGRSPAYHLRMGDADPCGQRHFDRTAKAAIMAPSLNSTMPCMADCGWTSTSISSGAKPNR